MMEMASWDGGISRTVQFLVPKVSKGCTGIKMIVRCPDTCKLQTNKTDIIPCHNKIMLQTCSISGFSGLHNPGCVQQGASSYF